MTPPLLTNPSFLPHLLLSLLPGIGIHRYWALVEHYGTAENVLREDALHIPLLSPSAQTQLSDYQQKNQRSYLWQSALNIIEQVHTHQGHIICITDSRYPKLLKEIHHPPPLLYIKGNIDTINLPQLAIIGSRHATHTGLENTRSFAQHLSQNGFVITSGLALGIDHAAHHATLSCEGQTIAVMATGIDTIYPKRHRYIADDIIAKGGTLVTEFLPNTPPKADHFPRRNRIISGISLGVLVVEAAIKSGSLITAKYALEQGREIFAIPSSIHNPQAKGCHQLIKQGAHLVETSQDIVEHLSGLLQHMNTCATTRQTINHTNTPLKDKTALTLEEQQVLNHIGFEPKTIDQLIQSTRLSSQVLSACLMNLEISHWIKRSHWGYEQV